MNLFGVHLANGEQDIARVIRLGCHHHLALQYQDGALSCCPGRKYLRLWHFAHEPVEDIARDAKRWGAVFPDVFPWNEANLESPQLSYAEIGAKFLAYHRAISGSGLISHWPALSPAFRYRECIGEWREAAMAADVVDLHCYGTAAQMLEIVDWYRQQFPNKELLISEYNAGAGNWFDQEWWAREALVFMTALLDRPEVIAAIGFIWQWHRPDMALPTTVDWIGQPIEAAVRAAQKPDRRTQQQGGNIMGLIEQYKAIYEEWVAVGGAENNFRKHLLGIGVLQPTADDLKFLAAEAAGSVAQLKGALDKYPF